MPKRKKIKESYNNIITPEYENKYLNKWFQTRLESGLILYSFLIRAEADSVIQIVISKNFLYNNIYHLTKFEFIEENKEISIKIDDLELLKEIKDLDMQKNLEILEDICKKYSGIIENKKEFLKNPINSNKVLQEMKMI